MELFQFLAEVLTILQDLTIITDEGPIVKILSIQTESTCFLQIQNFMQSSITGLYFMRATGSQLYTMDANNTVLLTELRPDERNELSFQFSRGPRIVSIPYYLVINPSINDVRPLVFKDYSQQSSTIFISIGFWLSNLGSAKFSDLSYVVSLRYGGAEIVSTSKKLSELTFSFNGVVPFLKYQLYVTILGGQNSSRYFSLNSYEIYGKPTITFLDKLFHRIRFNAVLPTQILSIVNDIKLPESTPSLSPVIGTFSAQDFYGQLLSFVAYNIRYNPSNAYVLNPSEI